MLSPLRLALLFALGLGLALMALLPPWMGEDELWQVEYATLIARGESPFPTEPHARPWIDEQLQEQPLSVVLIHRRFDRVHPAALAALQTEILTEARATSFSRQVDWAPGLEGATTFDHVAPGFSSSHQPPFYYLAVGWTARLFGVDSPLGVLWTGRSLSLLAFCLAVWATGRTALLLGLSQQAAFVAAVLLVLWPQYARGAAVVSNDVFARLFSALALWAAASTLAARQLLPPSTTPPRGSPLFHTGVFALFAALAILSKPTGLAVPLGAGMVLLFAGRTWKGRMGLSLALLATLTILFFAWRSSPVMPATLEAFGLRVSAAGHADFWRSLAGTSSGTFAWDSRHLPTGAILIALGVLALLGLLGIRGAWRSDRGPLVLGLLCFPLVLQLSSVVLRGVPVGRYLFPSLPALAILVGYGWQTRPRVARPLLLTLVAFGSLYLCLGLVQHHHLLLELP